MTTRSLRMAATLGLVAGTGSLAVGQIDWRSPGGPAPASLEHQTVAQEVGALAARPEARHAVLSFVRPLEEAERTALKNAGVTLLGYLGNNSYFVSLAPGSAGGAIAQAAPLSAASAIRDEWKIDPTIADGALPLWLADGPVDADLLDDDILVPLYVLLHGDVEIDPADEDLVTPLGGRVVSQLLSVNAVVVELPASRVRLLAGDDRVQWIEPPLRMSPTNDSNRAVTQTDDVQAAPYSLDGSGVTVLVFDGGTALASHQDFGSRMTVFDSSGTHFHSTHVAGTIGGDGSASGGMFRGMAPGCDLVSAGLEPTGVGIFLYDDPADIETDFGIAINTYGAVVANASIGTNTAQNGFPCSLHGQYGITSTVVDSIVRGSLGDPIILTWSAGNERGGAGACGTTYWTTAPPANAKNPIIVGALLSDTDTDAAFTSWGPTDDGRLKPDISGPGCQVSVDFGVTSTGAASNTEYITLCGTSMSAPTLAGLCALLVEDYKSIYGSSAPTNALAKAFLIHGAADTGPVGPDYQAGYGSARIKDSIDQMRSGDWDEAKVAQSQISGYTIDVAPGQAELKLTLVWDDVPGTPNIGIALVNDLDLRVIDPSGLQHFPWTLDPANPAALAVRTRADHLNNVEQVLVTNPAPGTWRIEVAGFNVPSGPQTFALIASPDLATTTINISVSSSVPEAQLPATLLVVQSLVSASGDTLVADSVMLHYRFDGGAFGVAPATDVGDDAFSATVPGTACGDVIEFYMSAQGAALGTVTDPAGGAADPYRVDVGQIVVNIEHDFETSNAGWTVGAAGDTATTGVWERADPEWTGAQPEEDASTTGALCWVTQAAAGAGLGTFDIDGGNTTLVTDVMDLSALDQAVVSFWVWYSNDSGAAPNADQFDVEISSNGAAGPWINLMTIGPTGAGTQGNWNRYEFTLVAPTAQTQLRFRAGDLGSGSIVEALVDEFSVRSLNCTGPTACSPADVSTTGAAAGDPGFGVPDGQITSADLNYFVNAWIAGDVAVADLTTTGAALGEPNFGVPDGHITGTDLNYFVNFWIVGCP